MPFSREHPAKSIANTLLYPGLLVGHLIWKESDAHPLAHPPIYSRPDAIEADSNISVVHATDFGSSLCKSRIRTAPQPLSSSHFDPFEGSRTFGHEYPSIQPIMFSCGYPDIGRNQNVIHVLMDWIPNRAARSYDSKYMQS